MRNLLVGNGINIQFNKTDYTAQAIVLRILKNCDREDFPSAIIVNQPFLLKHYIGKLFLEAREAIEGKYDKFAFSSDERKSLESFKKKYKSKLSILRMTDICFEDYYLIHDLACHKIKMGNPEQFYARESMRTAYLYAIYNDGKLNQLFTKYSEGFIDYLQSFDNIFTTNYDTNIESAIEKEVFHIHGQFDKKSDVYNETSFRNQLPDCPINNYKIDDRYFYLYSNALTTHCGAYKEFQINQASAGNACVGKLAHAYKTDPSMKQVIESWINDTNTLTSNLGYAVKLKVANSELEFSDDYHFEKFKAIIGSLEILGLSPWNDFHIFDAIDSSDIDECVYYYFDESECDVINYK